MKTIETDRYIILFNPETGFEMLQGKDGPDPEYLDVPSMLDVGIMGHCKNKCSFCYQGDEHQEHMSINAFRRITEQCKDHVNQIALGGRGDPNHHPFFGNILNSCVRNDIVPNYTTSGNGLTKAQIELTKYFCGAVAVSMYNVGYTFEALKGFMDSGMKTNIHFMFTRRSAKDAIRLINGEDIWKGRVDLGKLNAIVFLLFKPFGKGANTDHLIPSDNMLAEFAEVIKAPSCNFKVGMDSCLVNKVASVRKLSVMEKLCADSCEASRMSCYISPDSKMIPCSFINKDRGEFITEENTIQKIWNEGKEFKLVRNILSKKPIQCPIGG